MKLSNKSVLLAAALTAVSSGALAQPLTGAVATGTGYPSGATPITGSSSGTTASLTAALFGAPGQTTFLCGFVMTSGGTTSTVAAAATITGIIGGTLNLSYADPASAQGVLNVPLQPCIPAAGPNTTILINMPPGATRTTGSVFAWGYRVATP